MESETAQEAVDAEVVADEEERLDHSSGELED
jgi:hypothetical protein